MESSLFWLIPASSILALILAWYFYKQMMHVSEGTETMQKLLHMSAKALCPISNSNIKL